MKLQFNSRELFYYAVGFLYIGNIKNFIVYRKTLTIFINNVSEKLVQYIVKDLQNTFEDDVLVYERPHYEYIITRRF